MTTQPNFLSECELENILKEYENAKIKFGVHQYHVNTGYNHFEHCVHMIENAFYVLLQNIKFFNKPGYRYYFAPQYLNDDEDKFWKDLSWEIEKAYTKSNFTSIA